MLKWHRQRDALPADSERHLQRNRPRRVARADEAVVTSVGFVHTLHWASERLITQVLLDGLEVEHGREAPFQTEYPRHITSQDKISVDRKALAFLQLGADIGRFSEGMASICAGLTPRKSTGPLTCELGEAYKVGSMQVCMEIDSPLVSSGRSGVRKLLHKAGLAVPDMPPTHVTIARADDFRTLHGLIDIANEELAGEPITFDPLDVYVSSYTNTLRPVQMHEAYTFETAL